jgi:cytoplasmic iron level regulating protein YaaA (DUF328/UPF0246 family)
MKIVISPSKTKNMVAHTKKQKAMFHRKHLHLKESIKLLDHVELNKTLKIPKSKEYFKGVTGQAIFSYTGEQFKALNPKDLTQEELEYAQNNLLIFSSYYGLVRPLDEIEDYYLDNNSKIPGQTNLAKYWQDDIQKFLENELIINLASKEFSKNLKNTIDFEFIDSKTSKKLGTVFTKQLRGEIASKIIKAKISDLKDLVVLLGKEYNSDFVNNIFIIVR